MCQLSNVPLVTSPDLFLHRYGWTALHYSSTEGHLDIIKMLVQFGADINKRDKDGTCAALRAQWQGHEEVVAFYCNMGKML